MKKEETTLQHKKSSELTHKDIKRLNKKTSGKTAHPNHPIVEKKVKHTLHSSFKSGIFSQISFNSGVSYISPFALFMNATSSQIGILHSLTSLIPNIAQLFSGHLMDVTRRKKIILTAGTIRALFWILFILVGILFYHGYPHMVWIFIGLTIPFYFLGGIDIPAWFSWLGNLVDEKKRGTFFSHRNRVIGFFGLLAMIGSALVLDYFKRIGTLNQEILFYTLIGFSLLFATACISRFISLHYIKHMYEPRLITRKKDRATFKEFLQKAPRSPYGKFSLFHGFFGLAAGIASPFWVVYMLRNLGFSYSWYMTVIVATILFQLAFLPLLGRVSDRFGNIRLLHLSCSMLVLVPLIAYLSSFLTNDILIKLTLTLGWGLTSGIGVAGYTLATNNYSYDAVGSRRRGYGISYMNLISGVGLFIGSVLGALLAWKITFMEPLLFIFLVSATARFLVVFLGLPYLEEVRKVRPFEPDYLMRELNPVQGVVRLADEVRHKVRRIEHYI